MTTNRGMMKWQPFSAVIPTSYMINDILKEKCRIDMPTLSEDQKDELQHKMFTYYYNEELVSVKYYRDGRLYILKGKITNIDQNTHKIVINNRFSIFFSQIIEFF